MKGGAHLLCVVLLLCLSTLCSGYESPASRVLSDEENEKQWNLEQFQDETERDAPHPLQVNENDDDQLESLNNGEDDPNENEEDDNEETADDTEMRLGNIEQENELSDELDDAVDETPKDENDARAFSRPWWWIRRRRRRTQSRPSSRNRKVCDLTTYRSKNLIGKTVRIHRGFQSAMGRIDSYARECSVKIYVTSSFRKKNVKLTGTVVPPASRSNHFIGHAIDMNVKYNNGFCNSRCLGRPEPPPPVFCFIKKIREDKDLRWGGDFKKKDTVHIDDGYNVGLTTRHQYKDLYTKLQRSCK